MNARLSKYAKYQMEQVLFLLWLKKQGTCNETNITNFMWNKNWLDKHVIIQNMVPLGEFLHLNKKESERVNDTEDLFWKEKRGPNSSHYEGKKIEAM